jgi:hypothetical protein
LKELKLAQLDKVLYDSFTAVCSKGKLLIRTAVIENVKSFFDEMKITNKWTFSDSSNKKLTVRP